MFMTRWMVGWACWRKVRVKGSVLLGRGGLGG